MSEISEGLLKKKCKPCKGGEKPMTPARIGLMLKGLKGWKYTDGMVQKTFKFKNYYETMAFVNAAAWISHREDHHPDMTVGYNKVTVAFSTHSVSGLSENDFIAAAKIDALGAA